MDIEKANKAIKDVYICGLGWGLSMLIFALLNFVSLDLLRTFFVTKPFRLSSYVLKNFK